MKRLTFCICCLVLLFSAVTVHAQGFTGPGANPPPPPPVGANPPPPPPLGHNPPPPPPPVGQYGFTGPVQSNQYGFTGESRIVTTEQAKTFAHRTPVIITGTIVQAIGGDLYIFRDSSGEIIIRIGPREWQNFGSNIAPTDQIEISGELHRDQRDWQRQAEIHARFIRRI
jgi:uncharacterized protein (TIGR00156 family)